MGGRSRYLFILLAIILVIGLALPTGRKMIGRFTHAATDQVWEFDNPVDYTTDNNLEIFEYATGSSALHSKATWSSDTYGDGLVGTSGVTQMMTANSGTMWLISDGMAYFSIDHGTTWANPGPLGTMDFVYDIVELTSGNLVAVGTVGGGPGAAYSSDDGASWIPSVIAPGLADAMGSVTYDVTNNDAYMVSSNGIVYVSIDNGANWALTAGDVTTQLDATYDIVWTGGTTLAVAGVPKNTAAGRGLAFSTNGGAIWDGAEYTGSNSATGYIYRAYYNVDGWLYIAGYDSGTPSVIVQNINIAGGGQMDVNGDWHDRTTSWASTMIISLDLIDMDGMVFWLGYNGSTNLVKSTIDRGDHWIDHDTANFSKSIVAALGVTSTSQFLVGGKEVGTSATDVWGAVFNMPNTSVVGLTGMTGVGTITAVAASYQAFNNGLVKVAFGEVADDAETFYYYDTVGDAWTLDGWSDDSANANTIAELTAGRLATMPLSTNGGGSGDFYIKFYSAGSTNQMLILDSLTITYDAAVVDSITVVQPNGTEDWMIGSVQNITWSSTGNITDVNIELQREVAGAWESIIASTTNDGSYPWTVTEPTTTTATVRISKVGDASINDTSDALFNITARSGGGGPSNPPGIDDVLPNIISNNSATVVEVTGANFDRSIGVKLNSVIMSQVQWLSSTRLRFIVPAEFTTGVYNLLVYDSQGRFGVWGSYVWVISGLPKSQMPPIVPNPPIVETPEEPVPTVPVVNLFYADKLVNQSTPNLTLMTGQTAVLWAEFKNTGTLDWVADGQHPVRIGTERNRDRISLFQGANWILNNRPSAVTGVISPGATNRFSIVIKAPNRVGTYREHFGLVAENETWIRGDLVHWNIVVKRSAGSVVTQPSPSVGNVVQEPSPQTTTESSNETGLLNWVLQGITNLWYSFSSLFN